MTADHDELKIRLQGGDHSAFEELLERYQGPLQGFFFRNTRDAQLSEDLTQETLLKVYNQAWDYLPSGRFRGWMYRIARNLLIDDVRKRSHDALVKALKRSPNTDDDAMQRLAAEVLTPSERASARELVDLVDRLLGEIPEEQRQVFLLHHYAGLSLPEVAESMEIPLATSKSRLRLAREKLTVKLRTHGVQAPGSTT
ncbi:MAG: RNA polymerase sigma factor [Maioricimonas sp. JB049]